MEISVIVCTFNRANSLARCLSHLAAQKSLAGVSWEVVVVDNNSTDNTPQIVQDAAKNNLPVRYAKEEKQGLCYARNRGIAESRGKLVAYIDDDIYTMPDWLAAMLSIFSETDCDAAGGCIHLDESLNLPAWIRPDMYGFLGYQDLGNKPFQLDGIKQYPFGGNMAFNKQVVEKIGLFNVNLGRKGAGQKRGELFKGSETEFFHRLAKAGGKTFYQPKAIVYHQILPFQVKKKYFRTIHYNSGYQEAFHNQAVYRGTIYGIPLFVFPQLARSIGKYFFQVVTKGPNWAFRQQMNVAYFLGLINGYFNKRS